MTSPSFRLHLTHRGDSLLCCALYSSQWPLSGENGGSGLGSLERSGPGRSSGSTWDRGACGEDSGEQGCWDESSWGPGLGLLALLLGLFCCGGFASILHPAPGLALTRPSAELP